MILLFTFLSAPDVSAQKVPKIVWQQLYGGMLYDNGMSLVLTNENTFFIAGTVQSSDKDATGNHSRDGKEDILLMKLAANGKPIWKLVIGGSGIEDFGKMRECPDGGVIIVGTTQSNDGNFFGNHGKMDMFLAKVDRLGKLEWTKCYGGTGNDKGFGVWPTEGGGYLIGGESGSMNGDMRISRGGLDCWIARLGRRGEIIYSRSLGGSTNDRVNDVMELPDNRFLVFGSTTSTDLDINNTIGKKDVWAFVLSRNNDIVWQKCFGGTDFDDIYYLAKNRNGNIVTAGTTFSRDFDIKSNAGLGDMWVMEITPGGNILWSKTYGGTKQDGANSITPTPDGGYMIAGSSNSENGPIRNFKGHYDGLVMKIDSAGKPVWALSAGGADYEEFFSAVELPTGDFMVLGYAESEDGDLLETGKEEQNDFWFTKLSFVEGGKPFETPFTMNGLIKDSRSKIPLKCEISIMANSSLTRIDYTVSDTNTGYYRMPLSGDTEKSMNITAPGYMFYGQNIDMDKMKDSPELRLDVELDSIRVGSKVILNLITFDTGKWDLKESSTPELHRLLNFLKMNPDLKYEIGGHTDNTGEESTKNELSLKRAQEVRTWLLKIGISGYRMTVKGYGMEEPVESNETEDGRAKNRRVEVTITEVK